MFCGYCSKPKSKGWHDCEAAIAGRRRLANVLIELDELNRGGIEDWGDRGLKRGRNNVRESMRALGHKVKEEYGN